MIDETCTALYHFALFLLGYNTDLLTLTGSAGSKSFRERHVRSKGLCEEFINYFLVGRGKGRGNRQQLSAALCARTGPPSPFPLNCGAGRRFKPVVPFVHASFVPLLSALSMYYHVVFCPFFSGFTRHWAGPSLRRLVNGLRHPDTGHRTSWGGRTRSFRRPPLWVSWKLVQRCEPTRVLSVVYLIGRLG